MDASVAEGEIGGGPGAGGLRAQPASVVRRPLSVGFPAVPSLSRFGEGIADRLELERERGTPFLFVPVLIVAGIVVYFTAAAEPGLLQAACGAAGLAFLAILVRRHATAAMPATALALVALGFLAAKVETELLATRILGAEVSTRLTGRVAAIEPQATGRTRLTLDVMATERPVLRYAPERVRVTARVVPDGLAPGDVVSGPVRLLPPAGPTHPGGYDFAFQSYFAGLGAVGFFLGNPERVAGPSGERGLVEGASNWIEQVRLSLAARITGVIPGAAGAVAAALIAGVRSEIPEEVNEALRVTGLAHILSISGLHMALVAGVIMGTLRAGMALFPNFAARRPIKKYAAALALAACAFYLALSGSDVAADRSFVMLAVVLLAMLFDRAALTMRNLAIAALVAIAFGPHEVMGPSFQMSFAATAALIGGYAALSDWRGRRRRASPGERPLAARLFRMALGFVLGIALTSLVAGAATTIYGAYHFNRVSPLSLVANLGVTPFVLLAMWFAVAAMVLMPFGLQALALVPMGWCLTMMLDIARWLAGLTPIDTVGAIPAMAVLAATIALVLATMLTTALRWSALPFALVALALLWNRPAPDLLVSEDARLVAVHAGDLLHVNRTRPSSFTLENWMRTAAAKTVVKPGQSAGSFVCSDGLCTIGEGSRLVAHAETAEAAGRACAAGPSVLVVADATLSPDCPGATVLTARDLAQQGSAAIRFGTGGVSVEQAILRPYRPWNAHRAFSRAARGLAPWKPAERVRPTGEAEAG